MARTGHPLEAQTQSSIGSIILLYSLPLLGNHFLSLAHRSDQLWHFWPFAHFSSGCRLTWPDSTSHTHQRADVAGGLKYRSAWWLPASRLLGSLSPERRSPTDCHRPRFSQSDAEMHVCQLDSQGPLDATGIHGQQPYMDPFLVLQ